jgi:hypothetical protein
MTSGKPGVPVADAVVAAARRVFAERHAAIERMCEQMLVTPGNRGVLVTDEPGAAYTVELSDEVPFGEIHYRRVGC